MKKQTYKPATIEIIELELEACCLQPSTLDNININDMMPEQGEWN